MTDRPEWLTPRNAEFFIEERDDGWERPNNKFADPAGYGERPAPVTYRIREAVLVSGERYQPQHDIRYAPPGYAFPPLYYLGAQVTRETVPDHDPWNFRWYHALNPADQLFADLKVALVQEACEWFNDELVESMDNVPGLNISDAEVRARIARADAGENTREAERTGKYRYILGDLPFARQRALIEQVVELERKFRFEIVG